MGREKPLEKSSDEEIEKFLVYSEWRSGDGFGDGHWYHQIKFLIKENLVENSCVGECGQFGEGIFSVKDRVITIDFGKDGKNADFQKEDCRLFMVSKRKGIQCGKGVNIYYLK